MADYALKISIGLDGVPQITGGLSQVEGAMNNMSSKTSDSAGRMAKDISYVETHLGRFAVVADETEKKVTAASGRMAGGMHSVENSAGRMASGVGTSSGLMVGSLGGIETAIKGVIAAWGSWEIIKTGRDATMFAANVEQANRALAVIANTMGKTSAEAFKYRDSLRDLGITTNSSTNAVAQFMKAGLPLDGLNKLGRAAQGAAISYQMMTGEMISSSAALDKMIRALVTGNVTELHTLGINVLMRDTLRENKLATGEASTAVDTHKRHLLMFNEVLEKTEPLMELYVKSIDLAAKQISSSKRPLEELKLALGNLFLPELTIAATAFYGIVSGGMIWVKTHTEELTAFKMVIKDFAEGLLYAVGTLGAYTATMLIATAATGGFAAGAGIFTGLLATMRTSLSLTGAEMTITSTKAGLMGESIVASTTVATTGVLSLKAAFSVFGAVMLGWEVGQVANKFEIIRKAAVYMVHGLMTGWDLAAEAFERFAATVNPFGSEEKQQAQLQKITAKYAALKKIRDEALAGTLADAVNGPSATPTSKPFQDDPKARAAGIAREVERLKKEAAASAAASADHKDYTGEINSVVTSFNTLQREVLKSDSSVDQLTRNLEDNAFKFQTLVNEIERLPKAEQARMKASTGVDVEKIRALENEAAANIRLTDSNKEQHAIRMQLEQAENAMLKQESDYIQQILKDNKAKTDGIVLQNELNLAAVNAQEKFYQISTGEAALKRIGILSQSVNLLKEQYNLEGQQGPEGDLKRLQILSKVRAENEKILVQQKLLYDRTAIGGMTNALQKYGDEAANIGKQIESAFTNAFKSLEDALVKFVTTGKFDFKSLANSIIADLARIAVKQAITGPLTNAMGSALSGSNYSGLNSNQTTSGGMMAASTTTTLSSAVSNSLPFVGAAVAVFSTFSAAMDRNRAAAKAAQAEFERVTKEFQNMAFAAKGIVLTDQGKADEAAMLNVQKKIDDNNLLAWNDLKGMVNGYLRAELFKLTDAQISNYMAIRDAGGTRTEADSTITSPVQPNSQSNNILYMQFMKSLPEALRLLDIGYTGYKDVLEQGKIELQQIKDKINLTQNKLILQTLELKGLKDTAEYTTTLTKVREAEAYGLDNTTKFLVAGVEYTVKSLTLYNQAMQDQAVAVKTTTDAITKTIDIAISAAKALKEIQGSALSTLSPEEKYRQAMAAFTSNTDYSKSGELGKAALTASQQYNASGTGYTADYKLVTDELARIAGMSSPTSQVDQQITLLEGIKEALTLENNPLLKALNSNLGAGSVLANLLGAFNASMKAELVNTATADLTKKYADYTPALHSLIGQYNSRTITPEQFTTLATSAYTPVKSAQDNLTALGGTVTNPLDAPGITDNMTNARMRVMAQKAINNMIQVSFGGYSSYSQNPEYDIVNPKGVVNADDRKMWLRIAQGEKWTTLFPGLPAFASGGIATGPSIFGEAGPEAAVPLPDGRRIPVQITGSADNKETVAELKEQNRLLRELLAASLAGVRVSQAGFIRVAEATEKTAENSERSANTDRLVANQ
jgi:lambda family phage tail tape measure protein